MIRKWVEQVCEIRRKKHKRELKERNDDCKKEMDERKIRRMEDNFYDWFVTVWKKEYDDKDKHWKWGGKRGVKLRKKKKKIRCW